MKLNNKEKKSPNKQKFRSNCIPSEFYKIFADQTRLRILDALLNKPMCVNEISEVLDISQSAISHQLKNLRTSNLVKTDKEGKNVIYSISDEHIKIILKYGLEHIAEVS